MPFCARLWGFHYEHGTEEHPGRGEVWEKCWLTKDGHASSNRWTAMLYTSEDEAWTHLAATDSLGYDEKHGDWAWVEPFITPAIVDTEFKDGEAVAIESSRR